MSDNNEENQEDSISETGKKTPGLIARLRPTFMLAAFSAGMIGLSALATYPDALTIAQENGESLGKFEHFKDLMLGLPGRFLGALLTYALGIPALTSYINKKLADKSKEERLNYVKFAHWAIFLGIAIPASIFFVPILYSAFMGLDLPFRIGAGTMLFTMTVLPKLWKSIFPNPLKNTLRYTFGNATNAVRSIFSTAIVLPLMLSIKTLLTIKNALSPKNENEHLKEKKQTILRDIYKELKGEGNTERFVDKQRQHTKGHEYNRKKLSISIAQGNFLGIIKDFISVATTFFIFKWRPKHDKREELSPNGIQTLRMSQMVKDFIDHAENDTKKNPHKGFSYGGLMGIGATPFPFVLIPVVPAIFALGSVIASSTLRKLGLKIEHDEEAIKFAKSFARTLNDDSLIEDNIHHIKQAKDNDGYYKLKSHEEAIGESTKDLKDKALSIVRSTAVDNFKDMPGALGPANAIIANLIMDSVELGINDLPNILLGRATSNQQKANRYNSINEKYDALKDKKLSSTPSPDPASS